MASDDTFKFGPGFNGEQNSNNVDCQADHSGSKSAVPQGNGIEQLGVSSESNLVATTKRQDPLQRTEESTAVTNALKAQLNALAPINRLPPEVIAEIFSILCDVQNPDPTLSESIDRIIEEDDDEKILLSGMEKLGWMLVTQVCSDWRSVAINTPTLWRHVTWALGHSWARNMLSYSKLVPISVQMLKYQNSSMNRDDAELIAGHLSHMRHLCLSVERARSMNALLKKANGPAPLLQTLYLGAHMRSINPRAYGRISITQSDLFDGHAPGLRSIELYDVFIPWTSPLFRTLHSLSIAVSIQSFPAQYAPTLTQFLDALRNMPHLQDLKVDGSLPICSAEMEPLLLSSDVPKAWLGRLKTLHLGGRMLDVALALMHLSVPLGVDLSLAIVPRADDEDIHNEVAEARAFFDVVTKHINSHSGGISISEIVVRRFFTVFINVFPDFKHGNISLQIEDSVDSAAYVRRCFEDLPFRPIPSVRFIGLYWEVHEWRNIFGQPGGHAATVKSLTLSGGDKTLQFCAFLGGRGILDLLEIDEPAALAILAELPLPALETLVFEGTDFKDEMTRHCLTFTVRARKDRGVPLGRLSLINCLLPRDGGWVEELRWFVPDTNCNNWYGGHGPSHGSDDGSD